MSSYSNTDEDTHESPTKLAKRENDGLELS